MSTMSDLHYCINEARRIKRSLGVRTAAGYLRNQGVALDLALAFLVKPRGMSGYVAVNNWLNQAQVRGDRRDRRGT